MRSTDRSFTLLELILVVTVLAIVAGTVISNLGTSEDRAHASLAFAELTAVRDAVRRFRADTGFLPKNGPFARDAIQPPADLVGSGFDSLAKWEAWFDSPANLGQLFERPKIREDHPLAWLVDPNSFVERGRGWNGPYLTSGGEGWVHVGAYLMPDGSGDPSQGAVLPAMRAVADPYLREPLGSSSLEHWERHFAWWAVPPDSAQPNREVPFAVQGRPILVFDLNSTDPDRPVRIVGFGPDGRYPTPATPTTPSDDLELVIPR